MKILLTGFDPFGGETVNPAFEAVKLLPDTIAGAEIVKQEVPTEFIRAGEVLEAAIQANQPDVVICIGQAGGRSAITPEKVAINLMDGRIADNAGYQPIDVTIQEDGETAYFTSLPVKAMVQNIKDDLEITTNVRMKDVEEAQQRIVDVIRKLEEQNEIIIIKGGKDDIIA